MPCCFNQTCLWLKCLITIFFNSFDISLYKMITHVVSYICLFQIYYVCGLTDKIVEVAESERCSYTFKFATPAACQNPKRNTRYSIYPRFIHVTFLIALFSIKGYCSKSLKPRILRKLFYLKIPTFRHSDILSAVNIK